MPERVLISCKHVWDVFDEYAPVFERQRIEVDMPRFEGQQLEEEDLLPVIGRYDGILAGDDHLTARVIAAADRLRVIAKWGIGIDAIDLAAASARSIQVLNTPGVFGAELADYALGYLLMLARRQHEVDRLVRAGGWTQIRGTSLAGRTVGIVGLGSSGQAFARRVAALGMIPIGIDVFSPPESFLAESGCGFVDLDELLRRSDVISLHAPATESTIGIIGAEALSKVKPGVWLINTSRGSLVDQRALAAALADGRVAAAALDVFEVEPLPDDDPIRQFPNVILGAHNGSNTHEAVARTTERAVLNLLSGLGKHDSAG